MKLKDYFTKLNKQAVLGALLDLYPDSHYESYSDAWDELVTLEPKADPETEDMIICVTHVWSDWYSKDRPGEEPDDYINVHGERESAYDDGENVPWGERKGREISWAIEHTAWTEWLAWEVENNTNGDPRCKDDYQLLANILWEMTFCAYTNEDVDCQMKILKERMDEIEKWEEEGTLDEHLVPMDESFFKEMNDLLDKEEE